MLHTGSRPRTLSGRHSLVGLLVFVALAFFTLTRLGLWFYSFAETDASVLELARFMGVGLIHDLAFCVYAALPVALWIAIVPERLWNTRVQRWAMHAMVLAAIFWMEFFVLAEALFWEEFNARFNFIAVDYLVYTREVSRNIYESYPIVPLMLALAVIAIVLTTLLRKRVGASLDQADTAGARLARAGILVGVAGALYIFLGQSFHQVSENRYQNELACNGPYQFVASFRNNELDYDQFYETIQPEQVDRLLRQAVQEENSRFDSSQQFDIRRQVTNPPVARPLNLMLIMVESLSAEFMTRYGNEEAWTPNLDRLAKQSLVFDNMYATGTRTTRGLEAVTLSLPPTPGRSIVKRLGRESNMTSFGNILRAGGYDTRFIYGGRGYFDNMNAFFGGNGYTVVDQTSADMDRVAFSNAWGISDEDLFAMAGTAADEAHQNAQPFFFHIMTTSNHRPYTYPEGRIDIPSGSGREGAVKYTDWAISDFLERVSTKPWFKDTLFMVVADHCASSAGKLALPLPRYHIPCMIYSPGNIKPVTIETVASQIDIAPTLLSILGVSYTSTFVGRNILTTAEADQRALIGNYQHLGLYESGILTILSPRQQIISIDTQSQKPTTASETEKRRLADRCIAYYQGAGYIYGKGLNAWIPHSLPTVAQ